MVIKKTTLKNVYTIYQKYFNLDNTDRIDVPLAVAISQKFEGIPLWVIIVGASGDMKSVQLNSLMDLPEAYVLHNLTSKTIVNGYKNKKIFPDLAPELNNKIIIIQDMAQILKLPPEEKAQVWGQLRDLYDGYAGKVSGQGSRAKYKDLKITFLAGSTPAIDEQILIHQDLGTRELIYRTTGNKIKKDVMKKCLNNEEFEEKIKKEIKEVTEKFFYSTEPKRFKLNEKQEKILMDLALYISLMRATASFDQYRNELRADVTPEEPTRIIKQLKRMFICLKSLSDDYTDEKAFRILWHIAKSSCFPLRIKIFEYLFNERKEFQINNIAKTLKIGKNTVQREIEVMYNINLIKNNQITDYERWFSINEENELIKGLLAIQ